MTNGYVPPSLDVREAITREFEVLAEVIQDFDPRLELCWIPYEKRTSEDKKPWAIVHTHQGNRHIVLTASELDPPKDILARLWGADTVRHDVVRELEVHNAAQEALDHRRNLDDLEQAADETKFMVSTSLHTFTMPNGVKYDGHTLRRKN
jgi:hypothetical protein